MRDLINNLDAIAQQEDVEEGVMYQIRYLPYDSDKFMIVKGFTSEEEAEQYAKGENFDELADEWNIEVMDESVKEVDEGYYEMPPMDKDKYQERDGLEGPFQTRSGKVVYYDPREGSYYDPDTDIYMSYEEFMSYDKSKPEDFKISKIELPKGMEKF